MPNPPRWASGLVAEVCIDYYRPEAPVINWRRAGKRYTRIHPMPAHGPYFANVRPVYSSGHAKCSGGITVTAGSSRKDQRLVLLHELAHWLEGPEHSHSPGFWDRAFELYRRYGVPMRYALEREKPYRKGAEAAYRRNLAARKEREMTARCSYCGYLKRLRKDGMISGHKLHPIPKKCPGSGAEPKVEEVVFS